MIMRFVEETDGKSFVQVNDGSKKDEKEYASKGVAGTALGLGIINREITYWDVYVAVNAQYHDYVRLYQDWFPNLTEEQLDEKVIYSAINFWFKDEDAGTGKVWNYFKEI